MSVYIKLKEIRVKNRMSQDELAEKLGVSRTMIIHYEKGRNTPSLERTIQLANILGCGLDDLVNSNKYIDEHHNQLKSNE